MNNTFFDESGLLNIEDIIIQQPSFIKIMEDGIVTEEELKEQSQSVISLLRNIEKSATPETIEQIRELMAEISVLVAARSLYGRQKQLQCHEC